MVNKSLFEKDAFYKLTTLMLNKSCTDERL